MTRILLIAAGGAAGTLLRFWLSNAVHLLLGRDFPYGTLVVNVFGSLAMGLLYVLLLERMAESPEVRAAIIVGLLGAFTTFSTFSMETVNLIASGEQLKAGINILLSVTLSVLGCWLGLLLGRQI
ncbi:MAG: fluoride efflux transporter CrcB [Pseudomonadales bacterium]